MAAHYGWKQPMISTLDGDDAVRDSLRLLLECAGLEAREFASCQELLDAVRGSDGDCLILDLHMPEMSGIELLEEMRRRGEILPVILITGRLDATLGERAHAAGALAVVEKPYTAAEIINPVREALSQTKIPPV
jgi:two-component system response regulator FixJ